MVHALLASSALVLAVGEPMTTDAGVVLPDWEERVLYVLTNRARSDPQKQQAECSPGAYKACPWLEAADGGCYTPQPPLVWDFQGSRASRFQATYLSKAPCALGHNTCCTLRTDIDATGCDGDPACACVAGTQGCDCAGACSNPTDPATRMSRFGFLGPSGWGEVAHQFYTDPVTIFHGWVDESQGTPDSTCGYHSGFNGHRWLILTSGGPRIGVGHFQKASSCNSPYWVMDFSGAATSIPRVPAGVAYPHSGTTSTSFTFWANYYHSGGGAPSRAAVVVNGACRGMALEFGSAAAGTYRYNGTLPAGCDPYYFLFVDSTGAEVTYPTTGALQVGVGSTCGSDFTATRIGADCSGLPPPDAGTGTDAGSGADSGTGSDSGTTGDSGTLPDGGTGGPGPGGCGCSGAGGGALILLAAALLGRRRKGS